MAKEQIANRQLWFILFIMRSTIIIGFLPVLTTADALNDAWISAILVLIGSLLIVYFISLLDIRYKELTIIQYSQLLLGKTFGKIISLIILWIFLQITAIEIRLYAEVIVTTFLPETPMIYIVGGMVLTAAICIYMGLETLGRSADFLFFLYSFMVVTVIVITFLEIDLENIQPIMARGWSPVIAGTLTPIILIKQAWVITIISSEIESPQKLVKTALTAIGASIIVLIIMVFITIAVLGPDMGARSSFPILILIRSIEVSDFLQRTEALLIFAWNFGLFISVSTYLYCGARGIADLTGIKDYHALVWPMSIIWIFLSIHGFEDIFALNSFLQPEVFVPYGIFMLLLPLILLWLGYGIRIIRQKI